MVNRELIGTHYGLIDWLAQRVTAIVMVLYTLLFLVTLLTTPKIDYSVWRQVFAPQWMKLATLLFLMSLYLHAWIGMRNIFMDYIKNESLRLALYIIVIAVLVVYADWSMHILWDF